MKKRILGKTGFEITEIGTGTWQVGGKWGNPFSHDNADAILNATIDNGVNFIDTADVYSDGESEKAVGRLVRSRSERIYVATKCGRRISPHNDAGYTPKVLRNHVEDSLKNMGLETIDLIQLHCPPTETFYRPEIFDLFNDLKKEGKILNLGVSVKLVDQAIKAMEYDNVTSVQIIFNMLRQLPSEKLFTEAKKKNVGILARVPLASGLLTGKFSTSTTFGKDDHRAPIREKEAFSNNEAFGGLDFTKGLEAVEEIKSIFGNETKLSALALKWILMHPEVSCVIPGASSTDQVLSNIQAAEFPALTAEQMTQIKQIYEKHISPNLAHVLW
ncbi:aldo/keto reductase [Maribacter sp. HTCC2170]|uniref:aldo/keto reductase n=1 Tax=Maribacter sp. (strain HTCC2170 / KCCM 42371) TaxID=313603 RepID=UPI00006B478E|nr:aldo/keto reductase [Maribacter sp. HTCC2170]EAR01967.1 putative oxidoreductase protein [Maribacter sp. HTCC2170]